MFDEILNTLLLLALIFAGAGFMLGLFTNSRKVVRLEDKVARLKRTIRHLQDKLDTVDDNLAPQPEEHTRPHEARRDKRRA